VQTRKLSALKRQTHHI